jgi:hypothetical protein
VRTWVIYTLSDPRDGAVRYVGVTHQRLRVRLNGHLRLAQKGALYHTAAWIRALLRDNLLPEATVIETGEGSGWGVAEVRWITHYRTQGCQLTNLTDGGEGCPGHTVSADARARISAARKGKPLSQEHRAKVAAGNRGKRMSPEAIAKTAAFWRGRKHTPETCVKISSARKGRKFPSPTPEVAAKRGAAIRAAFARKRAVGWAKPAYKHTEETRAKISAGRKGCKHTPETIAEISASKRARDALNAS